MKQIPGHIGHEPTELMELAGRLRLRVRMDTYPLDVFHRTQLARMFQ